MNLFFTQAANSAPVSGCPLSAGGGGIHGQCPLTVGAGYWRCMSTASSFMTALGGIDTTRPTEGRSSPPPADGIPAKGGMGFALERLDFAMGAWQSPDPLCLSARWWLCRTSGIIASCPTNRGALIKPVSTVESTSLTSRSH